MNQFKLLIVLNLRIYWYYNNIILFIFYVANLSSDVVKCLPANINTGVYYGWAQVDKSQVYQMVMSIGWNPFYQNIEKSMVSYKCKAIHDAYIIYSLCNNIQR